MAGCVISNGLANSVTVASPLARRARIARRVGSAKAEKAASSVAFISYSLYKPHLIVNRMFLLSFMELSASRGQFPLANAP